MATLQHTCSIVRLGYTFMHRIYDTLARTHNFKPHYLVRLNTECRADIEWWFTFLRDWNGASLMRPHTSIQTLIFTQTRQAAGVVKLTGKGELRPCPPPPLPQKKTARGTGQTSWETYIPFFMMSRTSRRYSGTFTYHQYQDLH